MKIYLLIIILNISGGAFINGPPTSAEIVSSPNMAAVVLYEKNDSTDVWTSYHGELFLVDIKEGVVKEVPIPEIEFTRKVKERE